MILSYNTTQYPVPLYAYSIFALIHFSTFEIFFQNYLLGMADWNKSKTENWRSSVNRFCKYCKCWVADNKASWAGHEQGARHKKAVEDKLMEMKRQAVMTQKHGQDERHFLQKMEEAALRDYKHKDITSNRDFTARLYNNEDLPDVTEKYEPIQRGPIQHSDGQETSTSKPQDIGKRMYEKMAAKKKKADPMLETTGDEPDRWDKDYEQRIAAEQSRPLFQPVSASGHGSKYHKESKTARFWYEAKNEDRVSYYWNVTSGKSRWDKPINGYISIAEQQQLEDEKQEKAAKKARLAVEQRAVHGEHKSEERMFRAMPDMSRNDPYGGGGWKKIQTEEFVPEAELDLGLPAKREVQQPVIDKSEEIRLEFHEKTVASMTDKYGLSGSRAQDPDQTESLAISKPVISFRKRKNISVRERTGDD